MPPIIEGGRRRRTSRRPRSAAASFKSVALPLLLPLATMTTSMLLLLLLLPHLATVGVVVHAGPPPPDADCDDGNDDSATTATIKDSNRVFANINENYQSSSTSLDAVTRKIEDDYRKRQLRMRVYWKRIFEEIKVSNPVVFPPPDDDDDDDDGDGDEEHDDVDDDDDTAVYGEDLRRRRGRGRGRTSSAGKRMILDRWKQFLDGGAGGVGVVGPSRTTTTTVGDGEDVVAGADGGETIPPGGGGGGGGARAARLASNKVPPPPPPRFDGFQTWERQLQQMQEDVSSYLGEGENRLNELLQPRESQSGTYDMASFGVSSSGLKRLMRSGEEEEEDGGEDFDEEEEEDDDDDDNGGGEEPVVGGGVVENTSGDPLRTEFRQQTSRPTLSQRFGLPDANAAPPDITLPITIANLDPNLPPIPKPRPVSPGEAVLPHTDIADPSKNIWIVTTGALPWMTGTAVNPLLRAAYLSTGRRAAGGSVTLMLPWVEREADQLRVYGRGRMFDTPDEQEYHIRTWLRDAAGMGDASVELRIRWYTAWQEVLENSLYSMGDIIGLIPVSFPFPRPSSFIYSSSSFLLSFVCLFATPTNIVRRPRRSSSSPRRRPHEQINN